MSPTLVGVIAFACTLGGVLFGMWMRTNLPEDHLTHESRDTVKLAAGLIATMTALVLGLVTASAKSSFDTVNAGVKHTSVDILVLDRLLARYGPETREIRENIQQVLARRIDEIWPQDSSRPAQLDPLGVSATVEKLPDRIRGLTPHNDSQRSLQSRAVELSEVLMQTRWLVFSGGGASVPLPFLVVLLFWLTITFASFGLFAPRNATVFGVLFLCALSVGGAVFLILEMDEPFDGLLRASADPMRYALAHINQ
jgi:hypothetical protein